MNRADGFARLADAFDVLVLGGGATGTGAALDAASRGYATALVEAADFASATSSRSTKLIHGGVRYLQNGEIGLVRESLRERAALRRNAPHLVHALGFICPAYRALDLPLYLAGFTAYDVLAGRSPFPRSAVLGRAGTLDAAPDLRRAGLRGAVRYYDGQFDDARLALAIARSASDHGAVVLNYTRALRLLYDAGRVCGAVVRDEESGREYEVRARAVVNATGIFVDAVRALDDAAAPPLLSHSRGSHVVFGREAYRGDDALLVPKTDDGRVLFVIPWLDHVVIGTTDVPAPGPVLEVAPTSAEIDFIIAQANGYLERPLVRRKVVATFAGLRPLVRGDAATTAKLSREHVVAVSKSGLVTVTGGKWTTYRTMAQDAIDVAARDAGLAAAPCVTAGLALRGATADHDPAESYAQYGSDRSTLLALEEDDPALAARLDPRLPLTGAMVVYAAREEAARTVGDVLARRSRALFTNLDAALAAAPAVARLLARELGQDGLWENEQLLAFGALAERDAVPSPPAL